MGDGTLNGQSAKNLNVIASGDTCMSDSTVNTPNNGNATLTMPTANSAFKSMTVVAGSNAQNIHISCDSTNKQISDDCKQMHVCNVKYILNRNTATQHLPYIVHTL